MNNTVLLVCLAMLSACGVDRSIELLTSKEIVTLKEFQNLSPENRLFITEENEPGDPLLLCLTFVERGDNRPLSQQEIRFYHTSAEGEYEPVNPNDESTARLSGNALTDSQGRIFVKTILPGDYAGEDSRHIHTTVYDAQPEGYDIHFKQYTGFMGKDFIEGSDQHFLADLKALNDGTLVTFLTIEVKNSAN